METREKIEVIKIDFKCPKCETGYMRPTSNVLLTYPAQFIHTCNFCTHKETFIGKTYPYISYDNELLENKNTIKEHAKQR